MKAMANEQEKVQRAHATARQFKGTDPPSLICRCTFYCIPSKLALDSAPAHPYSRYRTLLSHLTHIYLPNAL